ncbi:Cruzipain [Phytophthora nicotianae]|uniref:Cruzipain n=2 Tax=Phytophthora nicotianae TaxID=4792 RepID=A0A0W8CZA7_PHYNI|nr:Cruzipain [Phytophthora nicotianae]
MSDEFNQEGRTFEAGADHLWTAIEKPDGVNAALEIYSINMTSTECDKDDNCYFYIETDIDEQNITVWNDYITPPGYENVSFYYRAAMVQGWNKFCFQGGLVVVRAQLPGVVDKDSGNPDLINATKTSRAESIDYYPTWPGIWMFGNLGRAIFTGSTARIWPFSYNECNDTVFDSQNQRISACDPNPGSGMNPYQGRGAPEIDILEGGGTEISSSMQVGPGMPDDFRQLHDEVNPSCIYGYSCTTTGANNPDVPTAYYEKVRGYKTWYQGMRYGANNLCASRSEEIQTLAKINASLSKGITENACTIDICPASYDVNADLGFMDNRTDHWGINSNGTCFPRMNAYTGAYLCNAGNTASKCTESGGSTSAASSFMYQMDALSANWGIQLAAYLDWVTYTVEWVPGDDGYVRWEVEGNPLYEIAAATVTNPPQDAAQMNPRKIMIEEPMYVIFNVALSSSWGSKPPNAGVSGCYGDGKDKKTNTICDAFPMKMKIDYIRVYQDTSTMVYGCDPASHPTKQWIEDNIDSYQDFDNLVVRVSGKASCNSDDDCTIASKGGSSVRTGYCTNRRCECVSHTWTGPRCTETTSVKKGDSQYGPPLTVSIAVAVGVVFATFGSILYTIRNDKRDKERWLKTNAIQMARAKQVGSSASANEAEIVSEKAGYSTNFV